MSDFGKGLCYCLGLFLAHEDRLRSDIEIYKKIGSENSAYEMWFYASADHLFDFMPSYAPNKNLQKRCKKFCNKVLGWRLPIDNSKKATKEDVYWAIKEAKDLLRLIDKANGVPTKKAEWS